MTTQTDQHMPEQETSQHTSADVATQQATEAHAEVHTGPHISIKPDIVARIGSFPITNSLLLSVFVFAVFAALVAGYNSELKKKKKSSFFYTIHGFVRGIHSFFESALGDRTDYFFPLVGAFFFYILLNNWSGLLPGVGSILYHNAPLFRANTADLNTTVALAIITMVYVQYVGIKIVGAKSHIGKFVNFASPIAFFVGILEIISEFSRILSFAFRLFGNIFAGEVLLAVVAFLIPYGASFPFLLLETFVGLIQALVFAMLSAVLFRLAVSEHH